MKNGLSKIALAMMIAAAPLAAGEYTYHTHSLFAIEGGMADSDMEGSKVGTVGLKIGAQSENYRIFLSARHFIADDISHFNTYGAEVQYMFNFSEPVNFFIGANVGNADIKVSTGTSSESSLYYGADAGFNLHASEMIDVEIGARYMELQEDALNDSRIVSGYASVIIKWKMD